MSSASKFIKADGVVAAGILGFAFLILVGNWQSQSQPAASVDPRPQTSSKPPAPPQKTQQQLMDEAANEMAARYPYLNTKAGARAIDLIIQRRDALIATGISPESALRLAAMEIAPQHQPRQ